MTRTALICGEVLIDQFPDRRVVAGAPLHVAVHLAAFGWRASLVTRLGDDADGAEIRYRAGRHGVDLSLVETDPELPTGTVTITFDQHGGHSFTIHGPAAWDAMTGPGEVPGHDVLYFGTLAMRDERSRAAMTRLVDRSAGLAVVDVNLRPPDYDEATIGYAVGAADVLKLSDEEVPAVTAALGLTTDARALHDVGPEWVCVTRGPDGASLSRSDGAEWSVSAPAVEVVDTVGAGDAFCAGLIHGLVSTGDGSTALGMAQGAASSVVQHRGGFPE